MRKYYFDNGKAIASLLGIFYHSALVFAGTAWLINIEKEQSLPIFQIYTEYINLFRMPLFLFISGYFAALSVMKYHLKEFTLQKITRLGIPLISTLLTFNIIERFFVSKFNNKNFSFIEMLNTMVPWNSNFQLSHLWFIYYVIIFSFLTYFVLTFTKVSFNSLIIRILNKYTDAFLIVCSIAIFGMFGILFILTGFFHELLSFLTIGANLPYFLLGVITYVQWGFFKKLFIELSRRRFLIISILLVISFIIAKNISGIVPNSNTIMNIFPRYFSLIIVLGLLYKYLNKSNGILKYMSESSYSVYLIHQPIIVVVSYYYINYIPNTSSIIGFFIVFLSSTFIIYAIDYILIRKTRLGMLLFTGKINFNPKQKMKGKVNISA